VPRRTTLRDVAARAGVSYQTVSKVINGTYRVPEATETRIRASIAELGYVPSHNARNLRTQRSRMIGYSWQSTDPEVSPSPVMDQFLTAMVVEAEAADYHLLPFTAHPISGQVDNYRRLIEAGQVDGFVLSSLDYKDPRLAFLLAAGFPFVAFGRSDPGLEFPYVDVDGGAGALAAVNHLVARGHRRIGLVAMPEGSRVGDDRLAGYVEGLRRHGQRLESSLVVHSPDTAEAGSAATGRLLDGSRAEPPTAVLAMTDTLAIGAMKAARARGYSVGYDLAIVGFDDAPLASHLQPSLTSVRQPLREIGHQCIRMITALIEDRPLDARHVLMIPELVVRESS
jgi:DNA-binding LacI/PurR family transcriptional regulator